MPRIQDIGAFNSRPRIRDGEAYAAGAAHRRGHGHLRPRQWRRRSLPRLCRGHRQERSACVLASVGCFGACFQEPLVNMRLPGLPLVILHKVQANDAGRILHELSMGTSPGPGVLQSRGVGPHYGAHEIRQGLPGDCPRGMKCPFSKGKRKSCCAIADSSIPTISRNTSPSAATRRFIRS